MQNSSVLKATRSDVLPLETEKVIAAAHALNRVIVLVTGVFDILHQEHILFLQKAKKVGDVLVVGVESDLRVRAIKGEDRPVNGENVRVENIVRLGIADTVFILPDNFSRPEDHRMLLFHVKPTYLAVSSHSEHLENKRKLMAEIGGEVNIVHEYNPDVSTTKILEQQAKKPEVV